MDQRDADLLLLRAALAGDKRARRSLYERVNPLIRARVVKAISNGHPLGMYGVEDMVQRVWERLFEGDAHRLRGYVPEKGTLEGYISRISQHAVIEEARLKRAQLVAEPLNEDELEDPGPSPEAQAAHRELARALRVHLEAVLPTRGLLVLRLLFDDCRSEEESAEIMGVSVQVVANWKHKIKVIALDFQKKSG